MDTAVDIMPPPPGPPPAEPARDDEDARTPPRTGVEAELEELKWQNACLAEALEAVLETRPLHVKRLTDTKKHCNAWPNCSHACGAGLHRTHAIALQALKDAFGPKYVERIKQLQASLQEE